MHKISLLILGFFSVGLFADAVFYKNPYEDISKFLSLNDNSALHYRGVNEQGQRCGVTLARNQGEIVFTPEGLSPADVFRVSQKASDKVNGGTEGPHLWSSYFIDDEGTLIPGQFGVGYRINLRLDEKGGFSEFNYSRVRMWDLNFKSLGRIECKNLEPQKP